MNSMKTVFVCNVAYSDIKCTRAQQKFGGFVCNAAYSNNKCACAQ